jgi:hypothetical protein
MEIKKYRLGDLKERIRENAEKTKSNSKKSVLEANETNNEFEPVFGKNVPKDNKKINADAYKEIKKEAGNYDGGLTNERKKGESVTPANNRGMSDLDYDSISKPFKDKVKSQLKGYPSAEAEKLHKNDEFGNAYYDSNNLSKDIADHAKEAKKEKDKSKTDGLVSSKYKDETEKNSDTMFESKKITKLQFKHTQFLSEGHMLSKVPDELKVEGKRFIMKDTADNEYLVEWTNKEPNVTKKINKTQVNEEMNRIKSLYGYKSKDYFTATNSKSRMNENKEFSDMLNKARKLMK